MFDFTHTSLWAAFELTATLIAYLIGIAGLCYAAALLLVAVLDALRPQPPMPMHYDEDGEEVWDD